MSAHYVFRPFIIHRVIALVVKSYFSHHSKEITKVVLHPILFKNRIMEDDESMLMNEEEFVQIVYIEQDTLHDLSLESLVENGATEEKEIETPAVEDLNGVESRECNVSKVTSNKAKRRACLTEFGDDLPNKRKNECAKRELTSIVNQVKSLIISQNVQSSILNQNYFSFSARENRQTTEHQR